MQYANNTTTPVVLSPQAIAAQALEAFEGGHKGDCTWRTLFSSATTSTDSMTVGIGTCAPGSQGLKLHRHAHAEIYHIIDGRGIVEINGHEYKVSKGAVLFIPGNAEHGARNPYSDESFTWLYVFAANDFKEVNYKFSGSSATGYVATSEL